MAETATPGPRAFSPWWVLLILPVAPVIGWGVGQLPTRTPPQPTATVQTNATVASTPAPAVTSQRMDRVTSGGGVTGVRPPDPAPAEVEKPTPQEPPAEISPWTTLDGALAESRRNGKPVLIDFNTDWCGPCREMKRQVFQDGPRAQAVQTAVIPVSIVDRAREEGANPPEIESLQQRYQVDAFPTLIVFSPASGRIAKTEGFGDAEATVAWITEAAKRVR